jgi:CTP:molybdopterin cytidylyltransferase MocA
MGAPKALLDAGGATFVEWVVRTLLEGGAEPVVVVVRDGATEVAERARGAGAHVVVNPAPDDPDTGGPASSVRAGLASLPADIGGALLHPVDHPRVDPATVAALIADFRTHAGPVTVPAWRGQRGHPVLLARALFAELADPTLSEGARTVVRRHARARRVVEVDDPGILADLDTPADYARAFPGGRAPGASGP